MNITVTTNFDGGFDDEEIEWLRSQGKEEPPAAEDEDISPAESNELFMRGILAFAPTATAARGKAAIRRTRKLRVLQAWRISRRFAVANTETG